MSPEDRGSADVDCKDDGDVGHLEVVVGNKVDEADYHHRRHHMVVLERTDALKVVRQHSTGAKSLEASNRIRLKPMPMQKGKLEPEV